MNDIFIKVFFFEICIRIREKKMVFLMLIFKKNLFNFKMDKELKRLCRWFISI